MKLLANSSHVKGKNLSKEKFDYKGRISGYNSGIFYKHKNVKDDTNQVV